MENKLGIVKSGIGIVVSIGVGVLAGNTIKLVTPQNLNAIKNIAVKIGGIVLADLAAVKAVEHFETQWDECTKQIKKVFSKEKENT